MTLLEENNNEESVFDRLPNELYEHIFIHLEPRDLMVCALVSTRWRNMSHSNKVWQKVCEGLGWNGVNSLAKIESNFMYDNSRFNIFEPFSKEKRIRKIRKSRCHRKIMPQMDLCRFTQMCFWKKEFLMRKRLEYNWERGRYVKHWFGDFSKVPNALMIVLNDPHESLSYLPLLDYHFDGKFALNVMSLQGKPKIVNCLENSEYDIPNVCVSNDMIVYVNEDLLKIAHSWDNFAKRTTVDILSSEEKMRFYPKFEKRNPQYFVQMNANYILVGDLTKFFKVWSRDTLELVCFNTLFYKYTITSVYMYEESVYYAMEDSLGNYVHRQYIVSNIDEIVDKVDGKVVKLLANKSYLIIVINNNLYNNIIVYDQKNVNTDVYKKTVIRQETNENWALIEVPVLLQDNLLIYLAGYKMKTINLDLKVINKLHESEFHTNTQVSYFRNVPPHLLVLKTRHEVEVWNWYTGLKIHTPLFDSDCSKVYVDSTRIILTFHNKGEIAIISFW